MRSTRAVALLAIPVLSTAGVACTSGATEASPGRTASSSAPATVASSARHSQPSASVEASSSEEESAMPFTLTSTDFQEGGAIPRKFSCDGEDVSPALEWSGAPDDTASLALIVDDPDANDFAHWVVFDMTASQSGGLAEAVSASPDAPQQGRNGFGRIGWGGPCPPSGTHRYRFTLYALDAELGLTGTPSADDLRRAAEGHVIAEATLNATYTRGG